MNQKERLIAGYTGSSARRGDVFTFVVYDVGGKLRAYLQGGRVTLVSGLTQAGGSKITRVYEQNFTGRVTLPPGTIYNWCCFYF